MKSIIDVTIGIALGMCILFVYGSSLQNEEAVAKPQEEISDIFLETKLSAFEICVETVKEDLDGYDVEVKKIAYEGCKIFI